MAPEQRWTEWFGNASPGSPQGHFYNFEGIKAAVAARVQHGRTLRDKEMIQGVASALWNYHQFQLYPA